jgi:hypothetical protein
MLRRLRAMAHGTARRRRKFDASDATMARDPDPPPEAVFDRATGPWDRRVGVDEET